jgi:pilus assembly protein Flp/PilA
MSFVARADGLYDAYVPNCQGFFDKELTMNEAISKVRRFLTSEDGPTAVEYAVMLALIVVAVIGIVTSLGKSVSGTFSTVSSTLGAS